MSRTGSEPKPLWQSVPAVVRRAVEERLEATVRRGVRAWGGYTPTPTYHLRLVDGRTVFFKAVGPGSNDFSRAAHAREEQIYREIPHLIAPWAPTCYGAVQCDDWQVLLLEDLGPKCAPPWRPGLARRVARAIGDFHRVTRDAAQPHWLPPLAPRSDDPQRWGWSAPAPVLAAAAGLAGDRAAEAQRWLTDALPLMATASRQLVVDGDPPTLLHSDLRSDNLRWVGGRLRLFDWPHLRVGPAEYDLAGFAQSVTTEGGPPPEKLVASYAKTAPLGEERLDAAVAAMAGYFVDQAWRPEIPGLPRLRAFQRHQLVVTLAWASRRLGLSEPRWLEAVAASAILPGDSRQSKITASGIIPSG